MPAFPVLTTSEKLKVLKPLMKIQFNKDVDLSPKEDYATSFYFAVNFEQSALDVLYTYSIDTLSYRLKGVNIVTSVHYDYISTVRDVLLDVIKRYSLTNVKADLDRFVSIHFILNLESNVTIKNFLGVDPNKKKMSILEVSFYIDDIKVKVLIDLDEYRTTLVYHRKQDNWQGDYNFLNMIYKRISKDNLEDLFEHLFYDVCFRDKYQLGRITKKKLKLIEISEL